MPRDTLGNYSVPTTLLPATTARASDVNGIVTDLGTEVADSLSRSGKGGMLVPFKALAGTLAAPGITFEGDTDTGLYLAGPNDLRLVAGGVEIARFTLGNTFSPGMVMDYAGSTAPAGWLLCFGQAVSRTTYARLFAALGTAHGVGDGSTTFNLPDGRGRVTAGPDNMGGVAANLLTSTYLGTAAVLGASGGGQSKSLVAANHAPHDHSIPALGVSVTGTATVAAGFGSGGIPQGGGTSITALTTVNNSSVVSTGSTTASTTGSQGTGTAFGIVQPTLVLNKIIYAGV